MNAVGKDPLLYVLLMHALESEIKLPSFHISSDLVWMVWFHHHVCESLGTVPTCSSELLPNQGQTGRSVSKRLKKLLPVQMSELVLLRTRRFPPK